MLIPIGFFGAGAAAGAYELISSTVLGSANSTISFTSVAQTYKHLQVRFAAKNTSFGPDLYMAFNGATSGFSMHFLRGNGSAVSSSNYLNQSAIWMLNAVSRSNTTSAFSAGVIDILDYSSTSKNTTTRTLNGRADYENDVYLQSGLWNNTAAVSQIDFTLSGGSFATGTRFSLYGIKG